MKHQRHRWLLHYGKSKQPRQIANRTFRHGLPGMLEHLMKLRPGTVQRSHALKAD
jgi:hypothetical protein